MFVDSAETLWLWDPYCNWQADRGIMTDGLYGITRPRISAFTPVVCGHFCASRAASVDGR